MSGETPQNQQTQTSAPSGRVSREGGRNENLWRHLLLLVEAGEVVPIVGRELLQIGPPNGRVHLYSWLAGRVAEKLGVSYDPDEATDDPLNMVACRHLERKGDPREIYITVFDEARSLLDHGLPDALVKLARIDSFKLFVTTTVDSSLQNAIDEVRFNGLRGTAIHTFTPKKFGDLPRPEELTLPAVFHLLGRISPSDEDYVVTEEDALEFVHSLQKCLPENLFSELHNKNLLVIGCRFPAWLVRSFIRLSRPGRLLGASRGTVFVVDGGAREDRTLIEFLRTFRTRTEVFEREEPLEFVDELYARWQRVAPKQETAVLQALPSPGAIFISYASEDGKVAEQVARMLAAAQLDPWLDRDQVKAGNRFMDRIRTGIRRSDLFIALLSTHCLKKGERYFREEWECARQKADRRESTFQFVFPIVVDTLSPDLEGIPEWLRALSWFSIKEGLTQRFVDAVKEQYKKNQGD
jgi:TIR domain/SIR2-like domain